MPDRRHETTVAREQASAGEKGFTEGVAEEGLWKLKSVDRVPKKELEDIDDQSGSG